MKKLYSTIMMLAMMVAALSFTACGGDDGGDDDNGNGGGTNSNQVYDVLQINGENYACYGYRSPITFRSSWDESTHCWRILLPCGNLSDAQKGKHNYSYMYTICLKDNQNLIKGSKFENYSPIIEVNLVNSYDYISGSAIVIDKKDDEYITVKFDNFTFENYTLNGTVQLRFHDNSYMDNDSSTLPNTISITMSNGKKYITTTSHGNPHAGDGYLTSFSNRAQEIFFHLKNDDGYIDVYHSQAHIILNNGEKNISDFPVNYDLNKPTIDFGTPRSYSTKYKYDSGSVKVISNEGNHFSLQFDNYVATRSGESITLNGKLYVVKE